MQSRRILARSFAAALTLACLTVVTPVRAGEFALIGVEEASGDLYTVSTVDASLTLIGGTGLSDLGALEFNPHDGQLYGLTMGEHAALYRISLSADLDEVLSADLVGELGLYAFEGGLAFGSDGTAYAFNGGVTQPALLTLDLDTGEATAVGLLDGRRDIAGLGWRTDGLLVGLDTTSNTLLTIDPVTAATAHLENVSPTIGSVGGMFLAGDMGYFTTAALGAESVGSNELFSFNAFTGEHFLIGDFFATLNANTDVGISGLAQVPEPVTVTLLALGSLGLLGRRSR